MGREREARKGERGREQRREGGRKEGRKERGKEGRKEKGKEEGRFLSMKTDIVHVHVHIHSPLSPSNCKIKPQAV